MTARLIYGVPETDNMQVLAVCDASSTPSASVTFGADIGTLETGKDTDLRFSGGGFDYALKGPDLPPDGRGRAERRPRRHCRRRFAVGRLRREGVA